MRPRLPEPLVESIATGRCLPIVGAGFSRCAVSEDGRRLPLWDDLARRLDPDDAGAGFFAVASRYERRHGRVALVEALRGALSEDGFEPDSPHRFLASLPFDTLYTTNFDTLLERAYRRVRPRVVVGDEAMPFHGGGSGVTLVKLHGDFEHPRELVLTEEDYADFPRRSPVVATHLAASLMTRTPLFLGHSRRDPDLKLIERVIEQRLGRLRPMVYHVRFDATPDDVEAALAENVHVINLDTTVPRYSRGQDKDARREAALSEFLRELSWEVAAREVAIVRRRRPDLFEPPPPEEDMMDPWDEDLRMATSQAALLVHFQSPRDDALADALVAALGTLGVVGVRTEHVLPHQGLAEANGWMRNARACVLHAHAMDSLAMMRYAQAQELGIPTLVLVPPGATPPPSARSEWVPEWVIPYDPADVEPAMAQVGQVLRRWSTREALASLLTGGMPRPAMAQYGVALHAALLRVVTSHPATPETFRDMLRRAPPSLSRLVMMVDREGLVPRDLARDLEAALATRHRMLYENRSWGNPPPEHLLGILDRLDALAGRPRPAAP